MCTTRDYEAIEAMSALADSLLEVINFISTIARPYGFDKPVDDMECNAEYAKEMIGRLY